MAYKPGNQFPPRILQKKWNSYTQGWLYPAVLADPAHNAMAEIVAGVTGTGVTLNPHVLKPEYLVIPSSDTTGALTQINDDGSTTIGAYSIANAANCVAHSNEQYVEVAGGYRPATYGLNTGWAKLVSTAPLRAAAVTQIVNMVTTAGFTGAEIDFEPAFASKNPGSTGSLRILQTDMDNYFTFLTELGNALHALGKKLQVTTGDHILNVGYNFDNYGYTFTSATLAGTGAINGTTTVTGSGTSFLTKLAPGMGVTISGQFRIVATVASNTSFTVTSAFSGTASGLTITATNNLTPEDISFTKYIFRNTLSSYLDLPIDMLVIQGYDYFYDYGFGYQPTPLDWLAQFVADTIHAFPDIDRLCVGLPAYGYSGVILDPTAANGSRQYGDAAGTILNLTKEQALTLTGAGGAVRNYGSRDYNVYPGFAGPGSPPNKTLYQSKGGGGMEWSSSSGTSTVYNCYSDSTSMNRQRELVETFGIKNVSYWFIGGNDWTSGKAEPKFGSL